MHFDSSALQFAGATNVLQQALVLPASVADEGDDLDGNPNTDKYVAIAWGDLAGNWPGSLPLRLFTANWTAAPGATGSTTISFTDSSTAAGWEFASTPAEILFSQTWQNPVHPYDINADCEITANDVVVLVNDLNDNGPRSLSDPASIPDPPPPYLDASGDDLATPTDVLLVINWLTANGPGTVPPAAAEGEAASWVMPPSDLAETSQAVPRESTDPVNRRSESAETADRSPAWPVLSEPAPVFDDSPETVPQDSLFGRRGEADATVPWLWQGAVEEAISLLAASGVSPEAGT
jgi:hypothetical protein